MKKLSSMLIVAMALFIIAISSCTSNKAKEVTLNNLNDSINYLIAYWNGDMLKQHVLSNDTNHTQMKVFLKGLDQSYKGKSKSDLYMTGLQIGRHFKDQVENGYFGDASMKGNAKMLLLGFVNALNGYEDVLTVAEADSVANAIQTKIHSRMYATPSVEEEVEEADLDINVEE